MAENESENLFREEMLDFKRQMLKYVEVSNHKFDGIASDVRDVSFRLDKVEQKLGHQIEVLDGKVTLITSKLDQVIDKVISHEKRLRTLEEENPASPAVN